MPLTVHHLHKSQSERIIFLLEELGIPYSLVLHNRDPVTALAPLSLKAVHPTGTAPVIIDEVPNPNNTRIILAESVACVEYILQTYAPDSPLVVKPGQEAYQDYLTWLHYANGTLQPTIGRLMILGRMGIEEGNPTFQFVKRKLDSALSQMEAQLTSTGAYLAGQTLTVADVMNFFTLTTMRGFAPVDLSGYPKLLEYLQRVSNREAYQRAMAKGDDGLRYMVNAKEEKFNFGPQNMGKV